MGSTRVLQPWPLSFNHCCYPLIDPNLFSSSHTGGLPVLPDRCHRARQTAEPLPSRSPHEEVGPEGGIEPGPLPDLSRLRPVRLQNQSGICSKFRF